MPVSIDLSGKIAIVTGSARGIGLAIARKFASAGAAIVMNDIAEQNIIDEICSNISSEFGTECTGFSLDISNYDDVKEFYNAIFKKYKRLDILVNNAGILEGSLIAMMTKDSIDRTIDINIKGTIYNIQLASRLMTRSGGGSIINLASIMGRYGKEGMALYSASKAAVIGMTYASAKELAAQKIRVNAIAPGFIETEMATSIPEAIYKERLASVKMNRIGKPDEVANTALFLASDMSEYVTGQVIGVDGAMVV
ncbi:MAG: short-chain dehydrogenase/reductase [Ignavibacteria bacterium]|nr:short-chain dehydrogenase/reductase [Ignavibacteria bacterium]